MLNQKIPIVEVLSPKMDPEATLEDRLVKFSNRYNKIHDRFTVSIPDNPMGHARFGAIESIDYLELNLIPEQFLLHINTFHTKKELDELLQVGIDTGIKNLLVISGDGSPKRHRLEPDELGIDSMNITSVELLQYINREYSGAFDLGVAYNQYEPEDFEKDKLKRKIDAGATYIATQPYLQDDPSIDYLLATGLPITLGYWFSRNIQLLAACVDHPIEIENFDPFVIWDELMAKYPGTGSYISCLKTAEIDEAAKRL